MMALRKAVGVDRISDTYLRRNRMVLIMEKLRTINGPSRFRKNE
jgi:hypothetical protein